MSIILNDYTALKSFVKALDGRMDTIVLIFDNEGLSIKMLDKAHILFLTFDYTKEFFQEYSINEPFRVILDSGEFHKVLNRGGRDAILELSLEDADFIVTFNGEYKKTFKLRVLDEAYETPVPPTIPYPCTVELSLNDLIDGLNDADLFSDKCTLQVNDDKLIVSISDSFGDYCGEIILHEVNGSNTRVKSDYSLDYLFLLKHFSNINPIITLSIGDELPLTVNVESMMEDTRVSYLLAPRINQE